ncbi:MAG TPA: helicase-associated domain-containing protein, partial [Actinomycetospora sp.]|nr:helicase-associated domain-containing protein [Actinomycetospora sp.]
MDDASVVLPLEVGLHLRGGRVHVRVYARPPVPGAAVRDPARVDRTAGAGAFELVRRTETLLESWGEEPPAVLRTGGLGIRDLRRLPALVDAPEGEASLVADLAYAAGLVAPSSDLDEVWLPTAAYDAWRRDGTAERWRLLAQTWLTTSRVVGLVGGRDERDRPVAPLGRDIDRPLAPEVRRQVLEVLDELPPGSAPTLEQVLDVVRWHRPRRGGALRDDLVRWTLVEAETLGVTGLGALSRAGRALLADDPAAAVAAVEAVLPEPLDHVLLQADLTAVAPGPLRPDIARELALLTDLESRGGASVHRFTADSVRRGLDAGRSAADVHDFLARVSRTPVPQPLSYLVDDVARRHGLVRVGSAGSFVRCDDPAVLAEIVADPRAGTLGMRRLASTVLVSEAAPSAVLDRLRRMGYAPAPEGADGSVVIARAEPRRSPTRHAPVPLRAERPPPGETLLAAAVRAVRAGDRASATRAAEAAPTRLGRSASAKTLAALRAAAGRGARTVLVTAHPERVAEGPLVVGTPLHD